MKRILIITVNKKAFVRLALYLSVGIAMLAIAAAVHFRYSQVFNTAEAADLSEIEKENSTLRSLLPSLLPKEQKTILEDEHRNIFMNTDIVPPPLPASSLSSVIALGAEIRFRILTDDPEYLRPVYDPDWKGFYFRSWLYLPYKNLEARHRIFAFSLGGSANFDIFGSLGYGPESTPNAPIDNHRNINFLIYGFKVKNVRVFQNQVAIIGKPEQTGAQVVSIVQNDLLPEGVETKDFLFQLSTPEGYEVDYLTHGIIRYEYLMKQIQEHTVHPAFANGTANRSSEKLLLENAALKQELAFFVPIRDQLVFHQTCKYPLNDDPSAIASAVQQGKEIPFIFNYKNPQYKRPLYSPSWKTNYKRNWAYIPAQIESNMHRLHVIPQSQAAQYDFFGSLAFHEKHPPVRPGYLSLFIYNFNVSQVLLSENHFLLLGVPSRTGAEIISMKPLTIKGYKSYSASLITPDNYQIDCIDLTP